MDPLKMLCSFVIRNDRRRFLDNNPNDPMLPERDEWTRSRCFVALSSATAHEDFWTICDADLRDNCRPRFHRSSTQPRRRWAVPVDPWTSRQSEAPAVPAARLCEPSTTECESSAESPQSVYSRIM